MANITTTLVNDSLATIIAAEALGYLRANTVMARLVARDWDANVATYGQTVKIPFTGSLSANAKSANTAVTLQVPDDTSVSVTLDKHKEVSFLIEDIASALARPDFLQAYIRDGMAVISEQLDADLTVLHSGLSQTINATGASGPVDEADFREARRLLNAAKAPLGERYAVLHEDAEHGYLAIEKAVNRDYAESLGSAAAAAFTGRFMGFDVFVDQKITVASTECKNLLFHRNAFVLVTRPLPSAPAGSGVVQSILDEDGMGLRATISYNPDHLGVQVTIDVLYGVAELRDSHGVVLRTTEI